MSEPQDPAPQELRPQEPMRHCPECGMNTRKQRCPDDHSPTIVLSGFQRDALSFRPDEIVAGRYRITGTLARGGYSAVYAASHHSTRQPVAIKMLSIQHHVDAMRKVVRRFWREAQITARMTSPHTVRIIDVGQVDDGPLFIAMERLRGRTLGSFLQGLFKQGMVMSQSEAIGMAVPVLRCLEEAHELGLVHRDLKPNNIMLARVGSDDNIVKVLDFGVARVKDSSLTADGNTLGTPAYMSPEQFRAAKVDARSDLYSIGVILFLAVCGRLPFEEKNIHALGMQHLNDPVPDPRQFGRTELTPGFVDALMCTLRKTPEERYQGARTMRQALELVRGGAATGLSVAHIQLGPAGQALMDASVSARDSQAFLLGTDTDDATVGIIEIDATIGIEEVDASAFADGLNAAADDPVDEANAEPSNAAKVDATEASTSEANASDASTSETNTGEANTSETNTSEANTSEANTAKSEITAQEPDKPATKQPERSEYDSAEHDTEQPQPMLVHSDAALLGGTDGPGQRDPTDEDLDLARRVDEALGSSGDKDEASDVGRRRDTLQLFSATPGIGRMMLQDSAETTN